MKSEERNLEETYWVCQLSSIHPFSLAPSDATSVEVYGIFYGYSNSSVRRDTFSRSVPDQNGNSR